MNALTDTLIRTLRPDRARVYLVLKPHNLAYARVPKAANSSIKLSLHDLLMGERQAVGNVNTDRFWRAFDPALAGMMNAAELARGHPDAFVFTFTRNPFSRVVSCYYDKLVLRPKALSSFFARNGFTPDMSFAAFLDKAMPFSDTRIDKHLESQTSILSHKGRIVPEFVGRVETIADDWRRLRRTLRARGGPELGGLRDLHNTRGRRPPTPELFTDPGLVRLVRDRYAADFKHFYPDMDTPR